MSCFNVTTGYLFDTPREVEFDEDELEDISDSDEEEATTAESEEDAVGDANGADDGMDVSSNEAESHEAADLNELDSSEDDDDISWNPTLNKTKTKAGKDSESSCGSEDSDDDGDEEDVSWHLMMNSDLKDDDDDSSGDDWSPEKGADNKKSEAITGSDKKTVSYTTKVKSKRSVSNSVSAKTPVSQTLIDLMGMDDEEEDDDDWKPSEEKSKNLKRRKKVKKQIAVEQETDLQVLDRKENVVNDEETDDKQ